MTSAVCVCRLTEYFGRWPGAKRLLLQFIIILVSLIEPNQQLSSEVDNYSSCVCLQSLLSTGLRKCTLLYFFPLCSRAGYACNKALFIWVSLHSDMRKKSLMLSGCLIDCSQHCQQWAQVMFGFACCLLCHILPLACPLPSLCFKYNISDF